MRFLYLFLLPVLALPAIARGTCTSTIAAVLEYEEKILQSQLTVVPGEGLPAALREPLQCLIQVFKSSDGMLRQVAHTSLTTIYGRSRNEAYAFDPRYKLIARVLIRESFNSLEVRELVLGGYADGMAHAYQMFCGENDRSHCVDMLPDNSLITSQKDLISAGNMYLLKTVFPKLDLQQQLQIKLRIKDLHESLKTDPGIRGLVIQELYREMFPEVPLGMLYSLLHLQE